MAELKVIKTAAEEGLAEAFAGARARLPGAASVKSLRESAFRTFEAKGLPHRRVEEWKYTDLRALMRDAKPLAPLPDAAAEAGSRLRTPPSTPCVTQRATRRATPSVARISPGSSRCRRLRAAA